MNDLIAALTKAGAPALSTILKASVGAVVGGPITVIATAAIDALGDALGVPKTAEAITDAIAKNPGADVIVRQVELTKSPELLTELELRLKDTQDARAMQVSLVKEGSNTAWGGPIVSILVVVLFALVLTVFLTRPIALNDAQAALLNITIGTLTAAFTQVVNYWLGSSHGSAVKDAAIRQSSSSK